MKYDFCLNPLSLPVDTVENAENYLIAIFTGIAGLPIADSTISIYSDGKLDDIEITPGLTYRDFKIRMANSGNNDVAGFVLEFDDKSPFLEFVPNDDFEKLTEYDMKMFGNIPMDAPEHDIIKFACLCEAALISLPTDAFWTKESIPVTMTNNTTREVDEVNLSNIFNESVECLIPNNNWKAHLPKNIIFSPVFDGWYNGLLEENQILVEKLIKRADEMNFIGTIKQTKALVESEKSLWEWRGGCPCSGSGRIRVLYKSMGGNHYILSGFIKTFGDYASEIRVAENALNEIGS
jgi:hypothetical protein